MSTSEKLALNGGPKAADTPFPTWPQFTPDSFPDILTALVTGRVNYWTGSKGMEFEKRFAEWEGSTYGISCTNGTAALHVAMTGLDIGPGDEVIVPSYSFIASSFAIVQAGAIPVFCDVSEDHTIDPAEIESHITKRTKAIVVVHLYGVVCDMDPILRIASEHGLKVVEDCAQCFGGEYRGKKVGTLGDVGCFSFCQSKHFTTGGEGGMVVTDDEPLAWECRSIRDHGYDVRERLNMLEMEAKLPYIHNRVGFNFRMTEMQSIIGIHELARFDTWNLPTRRRYAAMYDKALSGMEGVAALPLNTEERKNAYWWYPILLNMDRLSCAADEFREALSAEGIPNFGIQWPEAYRERAYRELNGFGSAKFPFMSQEYTDPNQVKYSEAHCAKANRLRDKTVSVFLHPSWEPRHIEICIRGLTKVLQHYTR